MQAIARRAELFRDLLVVAAIVAAAAGAWPATAGASEASAPATLAAADGKLPLSFEANDGQVDRAVDFLCRGTGSTLFLTRGEAVLSLGGGAQGAAAVVHMRLAGAARHPAGVGLGQQTARSNYLIGNDPRRWHTGVANYSRVLYPGVYPGVDLVYHGNHRRLEYDFQVAPGADPRQIRLIFQGSPAAGGAEAGALGPHGELILHLPEGDLVQPPPTVYQEGAAGGGPASVTAQYVLVGAPRGEGTGVRNGEPSAIEVAFALGPYDRSRRLIIDPALVYSTLLPRFGNTIAQANAIAVDANGNAYVTGVTYTPIFPGGTAGSIQPAFGGGGNSDAFVVKLDAAGAIVYSTVLGGSSDDSGGGITVDSAGNAYVTGATDSADFPVTPGCLQPANGGVEDAFVTKINAAGDAIVVSTYLGGSGNDYGRAIAIDGMGNAYVAGSTNSRNLPGVTASSIQSAYGGNNWDGFVTKINPAGTAIVYSTYLGGSGQAEAFGIALDTAGEAYVTGYSASATIPGISGSSIQPTNPGIAAFVTKIDAACRVFDTRTGTPMSATEVRSFQLGGTCGVAANARSVSANLTVVGPQSAGYLTAFPGNLAQPPLASNLNFNSGRTLANNALLLLACDGTIKIFAALPQGTTDVLLDVTGYFQ